MRLIDRNATTDHGLQNNPIQPKFQSQEFLRTIPHLRSRLATNSLLLRLRSQTIASLTSFFSNADFVQTHTPIITSSDCEGAGEVFTVSSNASKDSAQQSERGGEARVEHFFKTPKYLTVSSQLHLEALAQSVGKVWTLSPTFRAEKSDTPRHLSEFYMLEAELCFINDMSEVMDVVENMLRHVAVTLRDSDIGQELRGRALPKADVEDMDVLNATTLEERWQGMIESGWPRISYSQAIQLLAQAASGEANFEFEPSYENGLQAEHERYLAKVVGQGSPVFVTNYPRKQKPFYMPLTSTTDGETVACFDLLVPDLCELVGGSMREHRFQELLDSMHSHGMIKDTDTKHEPDGRDVNANLNWYQDLRRFGSVPHGGFGLGFDRLLCYLAGVPNVKDVVAFPRWYGRCDC